MERLTGRKPQHKIKKIIESNFDFKINFIEHATLVRSTPRGYLTNNDNLDLQYEIPWCQNYIAVIASHTKIVNFVFNSICR